MRKKIIDQLRDIAIDPKRSYSLQHLEVLSRCGVLDYSSDELCEGMREYSTQDPHLLEHLVAAPFIIQFGSFVRDHSGLDRWPTFGEVGRGMSIVLGGYVDSELLQKWSREYMVRKHAARLPKWFDQVASRRGTLSRESRISDLSSLSRQYVDHLVDHVCAETLDLFADYILSETLNVQGNLKSAMVRELVDAYRG